MFGIQDLPLFIASGLLLNMVPGPDSLLIVARSGGQGWRAGSAAALGVGAGTFVHVLAAALGLSVWVAASATAFTLVKLAGAAYLVVIGMGLLFKRERAAGLADVAAARTPTTLLPTTLLPPTTPPLPPLSLRSAFRQGFLTNVLNPKVAVFFLAFVPQFIAANAPDKALAFIVLGTVFNINSMLWAHLLVFSAAAARRRLSVNRRVVAWLNRAVGALFVAFGVRLALAQAR